MSSRKKNGNKIEFFPESERTEIPIGKELTAYFERHLTPYDPKDRVKSHMEKYLAAAKHFEETSEEDAQQRLDAQNLRAATKVLQAIINDLDKALQGLEAKQISSRKEAVQSCRLAVYGVVEKAWIMEEARKRLALRPYETSAVHGRKFQSIGSRKKDPLGQLIESVFVKLKASDNGTNPSVGAVLNGLRTVDPKGKVIERIDENGTIRWRRDGKPKKPPPVTKALLKKRLTRLRKKHAE